MTARPNQVSTLQQARNWLRENVDQGATCPCCDQTAKVYRRPLSAPTARVMIAMFRKNGGRDYLYVPDLADQIGGTAARGGEGTYGQYWGLMEARPGQRDDGSKRVGWWRLTDRGRDFVQKKIACPKYARRYAQRTLGHTGELVTIDQALGTKFNYAELMGWTDD